MAVLGLFFFRHAGDRAAAGRIADAGDPVAAFYRGKTIDLLIHSAPGTPNDLWGRVLATYMSKYIPGHPVIIPRNKPGAGGVILANYLYNSAPRDGTTIALMYKSLPVMQAIGAPGIEFDASKFFYLGSAENTTHLVLATRRSGIATLDAARRQKVIFGATSRYDVGSLETFTLNAVLGTRFTLVYGYSGGPQMNLAMRRGEVDGRISAYDPLWLHDKDVRVIAETGASLKQLAAIPNVASLVRPGPDQQLYRLAVGGPNRLGYPLVTTPGVPADRQQALRNAFDRMLEDPAFRAAATRIQINVDPVHGAELQQLVGQILATPPAVVDRFKRLMFQG